MTQNTALHYHYLHTPPEHRIGSLSSLGQITCEWKASLSQPTITFGCNCSLPLFSKIPHIYHIIHVQVCSVILFAALCMYVLLVLLNDIFMGNLYQKHCYLMHIPCTLIHVRIIQYFLYLAFLGVVVFFIHFGWRNCLQSCICMFCLF